MREAHGVFFNQLYDNPLLCVLEGIVVSCRQPVQDDAQVPPNLRILQFLELLLITLESFSTEFLHNLGRQVLHLLQIITKDCYEVTKLELVKIYLGKCRLVAAEHLEVLL